VNEKIRNNIQKDTSAAVPKKSTASMLIGGGSGIGPLLNVVLGSPSSNNLSSSVNKESAPINKVPSVSNLNHQKPTKQVIGLNDLSILGEILFGSIPIQIVGQNTKIHTLPQHKQTALSKVFRVGIPVSAVIKKEDDDISSSATSSKQTPTTDFMRHRAVSIFQQKDKLSINSALQSVSPLRKRSLSTSVAISPKESLIEETDTTTPKAKKEKKKRIVSEEEAYMCKSSFGVAVLLVFHDTNNDKDELQNSSQLQRLILSHFPIFEHRLRKLVNSCKTSIQNYLIKIVEEARNRGNLEDIFSGLTFNVKSFNGCLQEDEDISNASLDFHRFIISFLHAPRFDVSFTQFSQYQSSQYPIWQHHSMVPYVPGKPFSMFLDHVVSLTKNNSQLQE